MSENNRRQFDRHPIDIPATVHLPNGSIAATALELSVDGLRIQSPKGLRPGTHCTISLHLERETMLHGTVIWVLDDGTNVSMMYQMGIKVYAIVVPEIKAIGLPDQAEIIAEILDRIDADPT